MSEVQQVAIRRAAAVAVERPGPGGGEVLLVRRALTTADGRPMAFAGAWVFPGGKIDDGESQIDAARRELFEETGLEVDPRSLRPIWSRQSEAADGRRFSTLYFRAPMPGSARIVLARGELTASCWTSLQAALDARAHGNMSIPPATTATLERLLSEVADR